MGKEIGKFIVNGTPYELAIESHVTLLDVLRNQLGLMGAKYACGAGDCGACTVLLEGKPVLSCLILASTVQDKSIVTVEGLADGNQLHPIQEAFVNVGAVQCGFCTPGMVLTAKALLDENPDPTPEDVKSALGGNLCRCTGYVKIVDAVMTAAETLKRR